MSEEQISMFPEMEIDKWQDEWVDMPEYVSEKKKPYARNQKEKFCFA